MRLGLSRIGADAPSGRSSGQLANWLSGKKVDSTRHLPGEAIAQRGRSRAKARGWGAGRGVRARRRIGRGHLPRACRHNLFSGPATSTSMWACKRKHSCFRCSGKQILASDTPGSAATRVGPVPSCRSDFSPTATCRNEIPTYLSATSPILILHFPVPSLTPQPTYNTAQ